MALALYTYWSYSIIFNFNKSSKSKVLVESHVLTEDLPPVGKSF